MEIGRRIRELRRKRNFTLQELSKRSGVQLATLSRIENLKMVGTVDSHINIARALEVDITHLYKDQPDNVEPIKDIKGSATSPANALKDTFAHSDQAYFEILTKNVLGKKMMPVLLKIEGEGKTTLEQSPIGTEKFIYVLDGDVDVKLGWQTFNLKKNNTFYFDAALEHYFVNRNPTAAKLICISTPVSL